MPSLKQFGKEVIIYGIGYMLLRMVSFILLPLFTNVFTPEEFGYYSLIYAFLAIMQIFYNLGLDSTLMKFYFNSEEDRSAICTVVFLQSGFVALIFSGMIFLFSGPISTILLGISQPIWFKITAGILLMDTFVLRMYIIYRASNRQINYILTTFVSLMMNLVLSYIFVAKHGKGIEGALTATLLASSSVLIMSLPQIILSLKIGPISFQLYKDLLLFGLPFFIAALFQTVSELSDRFILSYFTNVETVGIYSAGYKLGSVNLFLVTAFNLGWQPYFLKYLNEKDAPARFSKIASYLILFLSVVWMAVILFVDSLIKMKFTSYSIIGSQFWEAAEIIPVVMAGYIFLAFYQLLMPGLYHASQTKWIAVYRGIGAAGNVILNILLIPAFGIIGAAWATCLSYLLMSALLYKKSNKLLHIPFNWRIIFYSIIFPSIVYAYLLNHEVSLRISILILLGFIAPLAYTIKKMNK